MKDDSTFIQVLFNYELQYNVLQPIKKKRTSQQEFHLYKNQTIEVSVRRQPQQPKSNLNMNLLLKKNNYEIHVCGTRQSQQPKSTLNRNLQKEPQIRKA